MRFFVGLNHPHEAHYFTSAFISINSLKKRKSDFKANDWIMDSGAFTTINKYGYYPESPQVYGEQIKRWKRCGNLLAAVSQDYMCEPFVLERTGLTIAIHQRLTIERYDDLIACDTGVYIISVLQGYAPSDYLNHIEQYGDRLKYGAWVGVGSICKRNRDPMSVLEVLWAIKSVRPDLRLHSFGVKYTALQNSAVHDLLHTADSMAWAFAARMAGRNSGSWKEAMGFVQKIEALKPRNSQLPLMMI